MWKPQGAGQSFNELCRDAHICRCCVWRTEEALRISCASCHDDNPISSHNERSQLEHLHWMLRWFPMDFHTSSAVVMPAFLLKWDASKGCCFSALYLHVLQDSLKGLCEFILPISLFSTSMVTAGTIWIFIFSHPTVCLQLSIKLLCKQEIVETRGVGLHLSLPVSLSQDILSDKGRSGWYAVWISSCSTLKVERERVLKKDQQMTGHLYFQSEDYFCKFQGITLADNPVCLVYTLGEPVDLVSNFVWCDTWSVMVAVSRDAALLWMSEWDTVIFLPFDKATAVRERV